MFRSQTYRIFLFEVLLILSSLSTFCQERGALFPTPKQDSICFSIQDFPSVCPYGATVTFPGGLHWGILLKKDKSTIGRIKYRHLIAQPYWNRSLSWIIPDQRSNLFIDYFNTAFKTLEYKCQEFQSVLDNNPTGNDLFHFRQSLYHTMEAYSLSCDFGNDSLAVSRCKSDLNEKANNPPPYVTANPCELAEEVKAHSLCGAGGHWGYIQEFWPGNWLFRSPIPEGCFIMSFRKNKACLDIGYIFSWDNHIAKGKNLYDSELNYTWVSDKANFYGAACLDLGYVILDNALFSIRPFLGAGIGRISQNLEQVESGDHKSTVSSFNGFRSQCGVKFDYKFWRQLTSIPNDMYNSRYFETKLSLKLSVARSCFNGLDSFWSINAGLLFDIMIWDY